VSNLFLDGSRWIEIPKNYQIIDITYDFANATIKSKEKTEMYKFNYENKNNDIYQNRLTTKVLKNVQAKLTRTSGLFLKDTDTFKAILPIISNDAFINGTNVRDIKMNVLNTFDYNIDINFDYTVNPWYRNDFTLYSNKVNYKLPYRIRIKDLDKDEFYQSNGEIEGYTYDKIFGEANLYFFDGVDNEWFDHTDNYDIKDIVFLNKDIVITDEVLSVLGSEEIENKTSQDIKKTVHFKNKFKGKYNFTHQTGFNLRQGDEIQKGVPTYTGGVFSLDPEEFTPYKFDAQ